MLPFPQGWTSLYSLERKSFVMVGSRSVVKQFTARSRKKFDTLGPQMGGMPPGGLLFKSKNVLGLSAVALLVPGLLVFAPAAAWSLVTNIPQTVAGKKVVVIETSSASQFFRLRKP